MKTLIIGATGATGRVLLPLLAAAPAVEHIDSYGRRESAFSHEKLHNHAMDFSQPQQWADEVRGDTVFICLGTTLKAAGSKDAQWQIDYQAALDFARAARQNGAGTLVLVSAAGANARSPFFYPRMKGALEEAITALGYPRLRIFRPPLLIRPDSDRPGEKISARILHAIEGITSTCGRILGKMGHSERHQPFGQQNYPDFRAQPIIAAGIKAFK